MKNLKLLFTFALLFSLASIAQAQIKVPSVGTADLSKQVLSILDNTGGLNLSGDQTTKLKADNKTFVDQLMKITGGSGSEESKKSSILSLKDNRLKFLTQLMGNDIAQKYLGNVLKGINPLKSKLGLAALAF